MKVGIIGATGYTGMGLLNELAERPKTELTVVTSRGEAGKRLTAIHPHLSGVPAYRDLVLEDPGDLVKIKKESPESFPELFFLAVSHKVSMGLAPGILDLGAKVIDLTGDFRLKTPDLYPKWYKFTHESPELLSKAVYGLPELYREEIKKASLVANPGCYPTSVILALAPLAKNKLLKRGVPLIADSKSGVSGAGRDPSKATLFTEVSENFKAYKTVGHQHIPEMVQELESLSGEEIILSFTPHLVPMNRGILSTIYATLNKDLEESELREIYQSFYKGERFIRIMDAGQAPQTMDVRGVNQCDIAIFKDENAGLFKILSAIDNLARGAVTQAIVNLNLISGEDEALGLRLAGFRP
jgi:N-acetyl-gamma-glutamyl-phosphate reductase